MTDPTVGEDDIGIEDLTRQRVDTAGANGRSDIVVEPSDEIPTNIFRVLLHVPTRPGILEFDADRV